MMLIGFSGIKSTRAIGPTPFSPPNQSGDAEEATEAARERKSKPLDFALTGAKPDPWPNELGMTLNSNSEGYFLLIIAT